MVPIVYHVVYGSFVALRGEEPDDRDHAPALDLVQRQTQALNRAFRGTGFSFRTAEATLSDFAPWQSEPMPAGVLPAEEDLERMVRDLTANREASLHVFLLREVENRAAPPDTRSLFEDVAGTDAIVMDWDYLPYVEGLSPARDRALRRFYFEGDMLVHLVGHFAGLMHTFEEWPDEGDVDCKDECGTTTDLVADTPAHRWIWEEKVGRCIPLDTCKDAPGLDPMTNYMNLEPDLCASEFTPGQVERMERMVRTFRPYLIVPAVDAEPPR
ncbi:MAG TPA: M43 family zinc metalloprotease [Thermoanaerobaculia bacterium]|nr:M43 family zinc metalloprotease [Thermoanaerobaculia bacterium]